jgi:hypothetical protein
MATDYLPTNKGWSGIDGLGNNFTWMFPNGWTGSGYTLSLGVPIIPTDSSGTPVGTLAVGATGAYDSYFVTLGQALVAYGEANADLRLGWEFNDTRYPWTATTPASEADFAAYFAHIVRALRTVPGENFKFVWNPAAKAFVTGPAAVEATYPGNAFVDYIGLDIYDTTSAIPATPASSWNHTVLALTAAENFAVTKGKPLAIAEWGLQPPSINGLGDDPLFIKSMIDWMANPANNVAYESYYNYNLATITGGKYPNSLAAFTHTWANPDYAFSGLSVTSVSPSSGPPSGGTRVTVTGSDFTGATSVTFANTPGTKLRVINDSTIVVTSPALSPRTANVVVTTPDGSSSVVPADHFIYQ